MPRLDIPSLFGLTFNNFNSYGRAIRTIDLLET
jgi:hypothetical protein